MQKLIENKPSKKIITIFLITFVIFSGLILSLGSYYSKYAGKVAGESEASDIAKLTKEYKANLKTAFNDYLSVENNANWLSDEMLTKSSSVKQVILALKVPADFKDQHLNSVIALSEIEQGIRSQNLDLVISNVDKLREIINNF